MARSATIGELAYRITAQTSSFDKAMTRTGKLITRLGNQLKGLAAGFVGIQTVRSGIGAIVSEFERVDELAKTARELGIVIDDLQALRRAGSRLAGAEASTMDRNLQMFSRRISEAATGTGEAVEALEELNLEAEELNRIGQFEALIRIADAWQRVERQTDKARLANDLFGRSGTDMINVLDAGSGELNTFREAIKNSTLAISDLRAQEIEKTNDALADMKDNLLGVARIIAAELAPAMADLSENTAGSKEQADALRVSVAAWRQMMVDPTVWLIEQFLHAGVSGPSQRMRRPGGGATQGPPNYAAAIQAQNNQILREANDAARERANLEMDAAETAAFENAMRQAVLKENQKEQALLQKRIDAAESALFELDQTRPGSAAAMMGGRRGSREEFMALRQIRRQEEQAREQRRWHAETQERRDMLIREMQEANRQLEQLRRDQPVGVA